MSNKPFLSVITKEDKGVAQSYFQTEYEAFVEATETDRDRQERNFKMYSGVNFGQWDDEAVEVHIEENRPINTFNYIQKIVDEILGELEENPLAVYYDPINAQSVDEFNLLQELYDYDFEAGNWENEWHEFKRNGLIYQGVMEYYQDFSRSRLGNVGIRNINPTTVIFDPKNQDGKIEHCRKMFKFTWMSARDISEKYEISSADMNAYMVRDEETGPSVNSDFDRDKLDDRNDDLYYDALESRFKVIECVYMQVVSATRLFNDRTQKFENVQNTKLMESMMRLPGSSFSMKKDDFNVCKVFTFAPGISNKFVLVNGEHPVQIGRLPFERWSAKNIHGQLQGVVDSMVDAQVAANKRESLADFHSLTSANGTEFIAEDLFSDDAEKERYIRERNRPGADPFEVDGDVLATGKGQMPVQRGEYPQDLINQTQRAVEFIQGLGLNQAQKGQSAGGREAASALQLKADLGFGPLRTLHIGLKRVTGDHGTAYFFLTKQQYSDEIPRIFKNSKKNKIVAINQPMPDGSILNSIRDMSRQNVMVRESTSGVKKKRETLTRFSELSKASTNPLMQTFFEIEQIPYTDIPEQKQVRAKELGEMWLQHQIVQMKGQDAQVMQVIQQAGQIGQEGPAGPAEAANGEGQGNLPQGVASGESAANNQSPSDIV
jgi:hypothetical protein